MTNKDIDTLNKLNQSLAKDSASADVVAITDPVNAIEESLSDFVKHSFKCVEKNRVFEQEVQATISNRLPEANFAQLIRLLEVTQAGNSVDTASLINPFAEASIARQKAEADALASGGPVNNKIYEKASKDILQGLTALNQLLERTTDIVEDKKEDD